MKPLMIGIAGGTGSGKSTFTDRLKEMFGEDIAVLYHDNYYRSNDGVPMEKRREINYDHPDSLETELLVEHLIKLRSGTAVMSPVYDFSQHNRTTETIRVEPKKIIIVEGILVLADQRLRDLFDIRIFVEADADERILRRAMRDLKERGRDIEDIMRQYLATVKPMHYMFVEPSKAKADFVINGGMNPVSLDIVAAKIRERLALEEN
ncbi:MAG: uridine kinase [Candidatus Faecivivens sp.]|nr:uridine kinase [Oscillospiraceae bacterium]MDY2713130.1 uridine kinase [Candidatus Faecivivens sp.]